MFGYPFQPQRSIQEQIQDQEALVKFLKEKYKEEKKPDKWYQTKLSLLETTIIGIVLSFLAALPITAWIISMLMGIKAALIAL